MEKLSNIARCFWCGRFVKRGIKYMGDHVADQCPESIIRTYPEGISIKRKKLKKLEENILI